jgi:hypothetical protein
MKKFFAILTLAAFTMGLSFAQTTPPADKKETTEKKKKSKKKTTGTETPAPAGTPAPKK